MLQLKRRRCCVHANELRVLAENMQWGETNNRRRRQPSGLLLPPEGRGSDETIHAVQRQPSPSAGSQERKRDDTDNSLAFSSEERQKVAGSSVCFYLCHVRRTLNLRPVVWMNPLQGETQTHTCNHANDDTKRCREKWSPGKVFITITTPSVPLRNTGSKIMISATLQRRLWGNIMSSI